MTDRFQFEVNLPYVIDGPSVDASLEELFNFCCENHLWELGAVEQGLEESMSGIGSHKAYTRKFVKNLNLIIKENGIKTLFDASCGDWNWMKDVDLDGVEYVGNDISSYAIKHNKERYGHIENVQFVFGDCAEHLKDKPDNFYDLCVLRHTLEHLTLQHGIDIVLQIKRTCKRAIITSGGIEEYTNHPDFICDGVGSRPISLDVHPFIQILGHPKKRFEDGMEDNGSCFGYFYDWSEE
tara:strand:+ start:342 stop:1055 length:714 start_codon:yes stop_codon:yes gene_type:complete